MCFQGLLQLLGIHSPRQTTSEMFVAGGSMKSQRCPSSKPHTRIRSGFLFLLLTGMTIPAPVMAQLAGGTISGVVSDPSGASLAGATVAITNTGTAEQRSSQANSEGYYTVPNLVPGEYEVTAKAVGFTSTVMKGVVLTVGEQREINV